MVQSNLRDLAGYDPTSHLDCVVNNTRHPVLIVVEGSHDVDFLRRLTDRLRLEDESFPALTTWEQTGRVIFIPFGGGRVAAWSRRFASLRCSEFHLYDRELEPETAVRQAAVTTINRRVACRALLLSKHSLENYLHPLALYEAGGGTIGVVDHEAMSVIVARHWYLGRPHDREWETLSNRARRRMATHAKRWLNTDAVDRMTLMMLERRDPQGELISWLKAITKAVNPR